MEHDAELLKNLEGIGGKRRRKKHLRNILMALSAAVVFCTVYALILPAITAEKTPRCGLTEHQHDETCYAQPTQGALCCPVAESGADTIILHVHGERCYDASGALICPLPEQIAHTHSESCYAKKAAEEAHVHTEDCYVTEQGALLCQQGHIHGEDCYEEAVTYCCGLLEQDAHWHTPDCFDATGALVCTLNEQEQHSHTPQCAVTESRLRCDIPEDTEHQHDESCYAQNVRLICELEEGTAETEELICQLPQLEVHTHTAVCYNEAGELICGKPEVLFHVHTDACFAEAAAEVAPILICGMDEHIHDEVLCYVDPDADVEAANDWESTVPEKLTGQWAEDFLQVARSQLGYEESKTNVQVDASGRIRGYTRYGAWYGDCYGDWCAMFLSFCLHYAQIPEEAVPQTSSCPAWVDALTECGLYHLAGTYSPNPGDLVFFDMDGDGESDHVGAVTELAETDVPQLMTIEGNAGDCVQCRSYDPDSLEILGYGQMPENPALMPKDLSDVQVNALLPGNYGNYTLSYNETTDALTKDAAYANYYNASSPLGTAGSFHLVGFDTVTLRAHTNGNVLANTLIAGSNFGTNRYPYELSYAVHYASINPTSASATVGHILVLGSEHTISLGGNQDQILVNGTKIDKPYTIVIDRDSQQNPFVDLERVENEVAGISKRLAAASASGLEYDLTTDQNNRYITLLNPGATGYFNITATELNNYSNNPIRLMGFSEGQNGTMVINVDCTGTEQINLPVACVYVDGQEQATSEVVEFSSGKVIWNFSNAQGVTINTNRMTGMVVALGATVNINQNLNGTVVADHINVNAESHRTDFTGTVDAPTMETTGVAVRKVDSDNISLFLPNAKFKLECWDEAAGSFVICADTLTTDENGCLTIENLAFNTAYRLQEIKAPQGYVLREEPHLFYIANRDTQLYPDHKPEGFTGKAYASGSVIYFPNNKRDISQPELTTITIQKQWLDENGDPADGTAAGITVTLWQNVYEDAERTQLLRKEQYSTLELNTPLWSASAEDLPLTGTEDTQNVQVYYAYCVEEQPVQGYTVSYENNAGITEGTILIKNTKDRIVYTLPETGGEGIWLYTMGGTLLMAAALLGYILKKRWKEERDPSGSPL